MTDPVAPPPPGSAAAAMTAVAEAVKGPGTPDSASLVTSPERLPTLFLAGGGVALTGIVVGIVLLVGSPRWGWLALPVWPDEVAETRVTGLVSIALGLCGIIALIMFRMASKNLTRFEAKAGPGHIILDTGDGPAASSDRRGRDRDDRDRQDDDRREAP